MALRVLGLTLAMSMSCGGDDVGIDAATDSGTDAGTAMDAAGRDASMDASMDATVDASDADSFSDAGLPDRCSSTFDRFVDTLSRPVRCVFVAESGDDTTGDGTAAAPVRSLARGLAVAVEQRTATGELQALAVSVGTYAERLTLDNGISIYGAFDADDGWSWDAANESLVVNDAVIDDRIEGLVADSITEPTIVANLTIRAGGAATGFDTDVYGVRVIDSQPATAIGGLVLRDLVVVAGDGAPGEAGVPGGPGEVGVTGAVGDPGSVATGGPQSPGGPGAVSTCNMVVVEATRGGSGGLGGGDAEFGCGTVVDNAEAGFPASTVPTCAGGTAGDSCGCVDGGEAGGMGNPCATGAALAGAPVPLL